MDFFNNHRKLFFSALALFGALTIMVAVIPAINNEINNAPLPGTVDLTASEMAGKESYVANGCVACHTQQVRNVDMDKVWGDRPGIPADYARISRQDLWRNTATLMGTERTGPDLTNVGKRQPSEAWNLLHLYQPRAVVESSIMPSYPWMFKLKDESKVTENDVVVNVPERFMKGKEGKKVVAKQEALDLVAYLQSLKQAPLPSGKLPMEFLYEREIKQKSGGDIAGDLPDGTQLYSMHCQACHQPNGEGLPGAFPALTNSPIVLDDNIELFVDIIMNGYNARTEYAVMNAVGLDNKLTPEEVTAIINHERTSWGNDADPVTLEEVTKMIKIVAPDALN